MNRIAIALSSVIVVFAATLAQALPVSLPPGSSVGAIPDIEAAVSAAAASAASATGTAALALSTAQAGTNLAEQLSVAVAALPTGTWNTAAADAASATGTAALALSTAQAATGTAAQALSVGQDATGRIAAVEALTNLFGRTDAPNTFASTQTFSVAKADTILRKTVTTADGSWGPITTNYGLTVTEQGGLGAGYGGTYYQEGNCSGQLYFRQNPANGTNVYFFHSTRVNPCYGFAPATNADLVYMSYGYGGNPAAKTEPQSRSFADPYTDLNYYGAEDMGDSLALTVTFINNKTYVMVSASPQAAAVGVVTGRYYATTGGSSPGMPDFFTTGGVATNGIYSYGGGVDYAAFGINSYGTWERRWDASSWQLYGEYVSAYGPAAGTVTVYDAGTTASWSSNWIDGATSTNYIELTGPTTNLNVVVAGGFTNTLYFTNGWMHSIGVVP